MTTIYFWNMFATDLDFRWRWYVAFKRNFVCSNSKSTDICYLFYPCVVQLIYIWQMIKIFRSKTACQQKALETCFPIYFCLICFYIFLIISRSCSACWSEWSFSMNSVAIQRSSKAAAVTKLHKMIWLSSLTFWGKKNHL